MGSAFETKEIKYLRTQKLKQLMFEQGMSANFIKAQD